AASAARSRRCSLERLRQSSRAQGPSANLARAAASRSRRTRPAAGLTTSRSLTSAPADLVGHAQLPPHDLRPGHQRVQLADAHLARAPTEAAVGAEAQLLRLADLEDRAHALGDVLGRLGVERLDVDDPGRQLAVAPVLLPEVELGELAR